MTSHQELAGQLLVVGFDGPTLSEAETISLTNKRRAGVILFRRNIESTTQLTALTRSIHAANRGAAPLLVAVDEEGGRVSRLPKEEARLGTMRALGEAAAKKGGASEAERAGVALGARLAELGFNLDFAPVLDVDSNPANPVIGDRSFSADPAEVARLGVAFAQGLNRGGVLACGKHFPGHGDTDKDSHFDLPRIRHARARLDAVELLPFRAACEANMDSLMSAHIVIESMDARPATLAFGIMTTLLRKELGFAGTLFSDDLEMAAVLGRHPPAESAVLAIAAGCDVLLVCKEAANIEAAFEGLVRELEKSAAFRARAAEASTRMHALRLRAGALASARELDAPSLASLA